MKILVADDAKLYQILLRNLLEGWGYEVVLASDGQEAWDILQQDDPPRLALLDWMMPKMDGIDVLKKIQEHQAGNVVYTILLTGKTKKEDIITALDAGANEYLSKPFDKTELKSRVGVGVRLIEYDMAMAQKNAMLEKYANEMETLAKDRAAALIQADRMATLGVMSAGIAHEINNPTSFISGNIQTVERFWNQIKDDIKNMTLGQEIDTKRLEFVVEEIPQALTGIQQGVSRIAAIVKGLKEYAHPGDGAGSNCNVNNAVAKALELTHNRLKKGVEVHQEMDEQMPVVQGSEQQLEQVLINLFVNATDAMEEQGRGQGHLYVTTSFNEDHVQVVVSDSGPGIPEDKLDSIFEPFFTTKAVGKGTGLGLSISQSIIHNHHGVMQVANKQEGGAQFTIQIPRKIMETANES